ncbi:TPA: hypothetical protein ACOJP0_001325 [Vibrio harveyi]|uniref:hypothetical protein n=1 Tax=Vibrio harveyi TaxID=669 RepID=UPI00390A1ED2
MAIYGNLEGTLKDTFTLGKERKQVATREYVDKQIGFEYNIRGAVELYDGGNSGQTDDQNQPPIAGNPAPQLPYVGHIVEGVEPVKDIDDETIDQYAYVVQSPAQSSISGSVLNYAAGDLVVWFDNTKSWRKVFQQSGSGGITEIRGRMQPTANSDEAVVQDRDDGSFTVTPLIQPPSALLGAVYVVDSDAVANTLTGEAVDYKVGDLVMLIGDTGGRPSIWYKINSGGGTGGFQFAGNGLESPDGLTLNVVGGNGIISSPDEVTVSEGDGIVVNEFGVNVDNTVVRNNGDYSELAVVVTGGSFIDKGQLFSTNTNGVACSSDGSIVYVVDAGGYDSIYKSIDGGDSFTERIGGIGNFPSSVACSSDGSIVYVIDSGFDDLYKSIDGGNSFTNLGEMFSAEPVSVACSSDGSIVYVIDYASDSIYKSIDGGNSFTNLGKKFSTQPVSVECSSDGSVVYVVDRVPDSIYKSIDGGNSFTNLGKKFSTQPNSVACSSDGSIVYVIDSDEGAIYKSIDGGNSFTNQDATFALTLLSVACSSDGSVVYVVNNNNSGGSLYKSPSTDGVNGAFRTLDTGVAQHYDGNEWNTLALADEVVDLTSDQTIAGVKTFNTLRTDSTEIALGEYAGVTQGSFSVAVGAASGGSNQGFNATAVGAFSGGSNQGSSATAVGNSAGGINQGGLAVAIGNFAGNTGQGLGSIAIGASAGNTNQGDYGIILSSKGGGVNQTNDNHIYIESGSEYIRHTGVASSGFNFSDNLSVKGVPVVLGTEYQQALDRIDLLESDLSSIKTHLGL